MSGGASSNNKIVESIKNNSRMTEKFREILKQRFIENCGKIDKESKSRNFLEILREKITDIKSKRESISLFDSIKNTSETVDLCCKSHNTPGCPHGSQNSKHEALLQSVRDEVLNSKNTNTLVAVAPIHDMGICD